MPDGVDADIAVFCPHCGYDVRTLTGDTCPECGGAIDRGDLEQAQLPWTRRDELSYPRRLLGTLWRVTFRTKRVAQAIARPVDLGEALRFRRHVVAWVYTLVVIATVVAWRLGEYETPWSAGGFSAALIAGATIAALAMLGVFLHAWTGVHTYWFHPRERSVEHQNRAIALSYYACAPLLLWWPGVLVFEAGVLVMRLADTMRSDTAFYGGIMLMGAGAAGVVIPAIMFLSNCLVLAKLAAGRSAGSLTAMSVLLPATWIALAALLVIGVPAALAFVALVVYTW